MTRKHTWLLAFCAAVAACETPTESTTPDVTLEGVEPSASIINTWAAKASILTYRRFGAAGAQNNIIYVVGGRDASSDATKTLQVYTIATNSWAFKADLPVNRSSLNGGSFLNGRLYVSGGQSNTGGAMKTLYSYNPNTNTWTKHKNLPVAHSEPEPPATRLRPGEQQLGSQGIAALQAAERHGRGAERLPLGGGRYRLHGTRRPAHREPLGGGLHALAGCRSRHRRS